MKRSKWVEVVALVAFATSSLVEADDISKITPEANLRRLEQARLQDRYELTESTIRMIESAAQILEHELGKPLPPTASLKSVDDLAREMVPKLMKQWQGTDGWCASIMYWSDGEHRVLLSYGRDGSPDIDYERALTSAEFKSAICRGRAEGFDRDLVYLDGQLCTGMPWP